MTAQSVVAVVLALATLAGAWRVWRRHPRARPVLVLMQAVVALSLYAALFPPLRDAAPEAMTVLTGGATRDRIAALPQGARAIALPEAQAPPGAERVPDLATALRHHPGVAMLRVVGHGLTSRDRDAARGHAIEFIAAPLPDGVIELTAPSAVRAGSLWRVTGRVNGGDGGRVDLLDPGGNVTAAATVGEGGAFVLHATAGVAGPARYGVRAFKADGTMLDEVDVPVVVREGSALRVLLLAANPNPELKYLRRWTTDAGLTLNARVGLSPGIALLEGDVALSPDALRATDVLVIDERAWSGLGAGARETLRSAVREGLGLVLLPRGPLPRTASDDWAGFGLATTADESARAAPIDAALALDGRERMTLSRLPLAVTGQGAAPLLTADDGNPLGWFAAYGQGRVALWTLTDSWRLAVAGHRDRFGTLWSRVFETVARARGGPELEVPGRPRVGERSTLCNLPADATIDGAPLAVSAPVDAPRCTAWWPERAGWHAVDSGDTDWAVHVDAPDAAAALVAASTQAATRQLALEPLPSAIRPPAVQMARWPFAAAWLAAAALLWWLERRQPARQ